MKIGRKIRQRREALKMTQAELAQAWGISQPALNKIENGKTESPRNLDIAAKILKTSVEWLRTGDINYTQPTKPGGLGDAPYNSGTPSLGQDETIKLYGFASPSGDRTIIRAADTPFPYEEIERPVHLMGVKDAFSLRVYGDSMEPRYFHGEIVYVRPTYPAKDQDCVVILKDGTAYVKKFLRTTKGKVVLSQYNPVKEIEHDLKEIDQIYSIEGRKK